MASAHECAIIITCLRLCAKKSTRFVNIGNKSKILRIDYCTILSLAMSSSDDHRTQQDWTRARCVKREGMLYWGRKTVWFDNDQAL